MEAIICTSKKEIIGILKEEIRCTLKVEVIYCTYIEYAFNTASKAIPVACTCIETCASITRQTEMKNEKKN